jgi:hypothetical protein
VDHREDEGRTIQARPLESLRAFHKGWYSELVTTMPLISDLTARRSNA